MNKKFKHPSSRYERMLIEKKKADKQRSRARKTRAAPTDTSIPEKEDGTAIVSDLGGEHKGPINPIPHPTGLHQIRTRGSENGPWSLEGFR